MNGAGAAAAAAAAVAQAIKASGVIVRLEPKEFLKLLNRNSSGLVVHALAGLFKFSTSHTYLMGYKGLAFYTRCREPIPLPGTCEVMEAQKVWMPG